MMTSRSRKAPIQPRHGFEVDRGILADRRVWTAAGLHADDAIGCERLVAHEELRVFFGVDIVGDDGELVAFAQCATERERERRLAGATGPPMPTRRGPPLFALPFTGISLLYACVLSRHDLNRRL